MKVQDWMNDSNKMNYVMDEMGIHILSQVLGTGIGVVCKKSMWTTKKDNDASDIDIWFAFLGLGSFLPLTPLEPEEEKKLLKVCAPHIYQMRYRHKKVVRSKFNNIHEIPSVKHITL